MPTAPELSRVRTFLFAGMSAVWLSEMSFLGFQPLSRIWGHLWQVAPPTDPQLNTALYTIWSIGAPAKGALFVMAIFGLRSRHPATRTALFASMALVPPLNIAFPFRYQGFLPGPVTVATVLSTILWVSFFVFRERSPRPEQPEAGTSGALDRSGWEIFQQLWLGANAATLTLLALLFLFWPETILRLALPCLSGLLKPESGQLSSLIHVGMACGTHFLAVSTACWLATIKSRSNPGLRQAVAVAITTLAGLFSVFPLRQIFQEMGGACATSSILMISVPLFAGWLLYLFADAKEPASRARARTASNCIDTPPRPARRTP